jgi:transcriptional regulator with XRE-family HTH domain
MSAHELAVATGITRQRIHALEIGHFDPTYELLVALAEGLGIPVSTLVTLAEQLKKSNEP